MNAFEWLRAYLLARVPNRTAAAAVGLPLACALYERQRLVACGEFGQDEQVGAMLRRAPKIVARIAASEANA